MKLVSEISIILATGGAMATNTYSQPMSMAKGTTTSIAAHTMAPSVTYKTGYTASMAPPAQVGGPATHTVTVGGPTGLSYTPSQIMAEIHDVVRFVFMSQNHTVTQSTFGKPCNKMAPDAVDSGFLPNPNNTKVPPPTFDYTVTAKEPTWWYCKQRTGNHCGKGMVFAINPTLEKNFDTFKAAAISINGTATTTAPAAGATTVSAVSSTVTLIAGGGNGTGAATTTAAAATGGMTTHSAAPPIATGWNQGGSGASCNCACFCGVGSYPAGDGVGSYGGYGGSLPAPW